MYDALILEETTVALHKVGAGESFARILHLRIAEGEPYLVNLIGSEKTVDNLYVGAKKGYIA